MNAFLLVILLGIVQGVTEFLPISSTGHMILVESFINSPNISKHFMDNFLVIVQFGSIISVILYFWGDIHPFTKDRDVLIERVTLWSKIIVGVIPAGIIGFLADDYITEMFMGNTKIVAIMLIVYGIILYFIEDKLKSPKVNSLKAITYKTAFLIGCFQCLAMIPGTSRSGATIVGALLLGLAKSTGAEFSFFLAIPTMFGATLLKLMKSGLDFTSQEWLLMFLGSFVAFVVAYVVIKWFMGYIKTRSFKIFGVYRIILGILVLLLIR